MKQERQTAVQTELLEAFETLFAGKALLTLEDVMSAIGCTETVIETWMKRQRQDRRPPRVLVGREVRFPKRAFVAWLVEEQSGQ